MVDRRPRPGGASAPAAAGDGRGQDAEGGGVAVQAESSNEALLKRPSSFRRRASAASTLPSRSFASARSGASSSDGGEGQGEDGAEGAGEVVGVGVRDGLLTGGSESDSDLSDDFFDAVEMVPDSDRGGRGESRTTPFNEGPVVAHQVFGRGGVFLPY